MHRFPAILVATICFLLYIGNSASADVPPLRANSPEDLQFGLSSDMRYEPIPGSSGAVPINILIVPEPFAPPAIATDPIYKQRTTRALYIYEGAGQGKQIAVRQRVVVHFEPDDRDAAIRSARLIARLMRIHRERFNRETTFHRATTIAHVWFVPSPPNSVDVGGETRDSNVYIFSATTIKKPIELVRTITHEWGHETLPAARGFTEPESDAAGYLGERLYMNYLLFDSIDPKIPRVDDGTTPVSLREYYDRQVKPLRERYQKSGPYSKLLDGDSKESMDYYIGAVLESDESLGSRLVGDALYSIEDTSPRDFLRALETAVAQKLPEGVFVSMRAWLPLKSGRYVMNPVSGGGRISLTGPQSLGAIADGPKSGLPKSHPGEKRDGTFRVTKPGWFRVTAGGSLSEFTIKSVEASEK